MLDTVYCLVELVRIKQKSTRIAPNDRVSVVANIALVFVIVCVAKHPCLTVYSICEVISAAAVVSH